MKRATLLLLSLLLLPATVHAEGGIIDTLKETAQKLMGQEAAGSGENGLKPGETQGNYIIHFKNGGTLDTDNYEMEKDSVKVSLETGAIYLDRAMIKCIEEVTGPERETVRTIQVEAPAKPAAAPPQTQREKAGAPPAGAPPATPLEMTDNNDHTEAWWRVRVKEWKDKKADAEERYKKAQRDWNTYEGTLNSLVSGGDASQYDIIRYQDLRGAARVNMDQAQADMDAADKMLNEVLPEEARKAGAPPGWAR